MKAFALTIKVFGSFIKNCGTRREYIFTANGITKFRFEEYGLVNVVTHQQNLKDLFPDIGINTLQVPLYNSIVLGNFSLFTARKFLIRLQTGTGYWNEANAILLQRRWYRGGIFWALFQFLVLFGF